MILDSRSLYWAALLFWREKHSSYRMFSGRKISFSHSKSCQVLLLLSSQVTLMVFIRGSKLYRWRTSNHSIMQLTQRCQDIHSDFLFNHQSISGAGESECTSRIIWFARNILYKEIFLWIYFWWEKANYVCKNTNKTNRTTKSCATINVLVQYLWLHKFLWHVCYFFYLCSISFNISGSWLIFHLLGYCICIFGVINHPFSYSSSF